MSGWYALAFKGKPSLRKVQRYYPFTLPLSADILAIVDAAVLVLRREREMPNDTAAMKRIAGHESAFALALGRPREEIRKEFIAEIVWRATQGYIQTSRDDEDVLLMMEIA